MTRSIIQGNLAEVHLNTWSSQNLGADRKAHGIKAVKDFMVEAFTAVPNFKLKLINELSNENSLACEWVMSGTPAKKLDGLDATGKSFSVRGVSFAELEHNKIKRWSDYYDRVLLLSQLGVISAQE